MIDGVNGSCPVLLAQAIYLITILRRCIYCKLQAERRFGPIHHIYVRSHLRATRRGLIEGQLDEIEMDVLFMKHNGETIIKTDGYAVRSIIASEELLLDARK